MPAVHRHGDGRLCGATTVVTGQSTVKFNGRLVSVDGDPNTHDAGHNKPVTGKLNIYAENKLIIVVGDTTYDIDGALHPPGANDPSEGSDNTFAY